MEFMQITLMLSLLLCALVAGITMTFAVVVMPGIKTLGSRAYLQSFKAMDRIIQDGHPVFMVVWLGSALSVIAAAVLGIWWLDGLTHVLVVAASLIFVFGVQVPTIAINIPLNNRLQSLDLDAISESAVTEARAEFEPRWVRWNTIRTVLAIATSVLLLLALVSR